MIYETRLGGHGIWACSVGLFWILGSGCAFFSGSFGGVRYPIQVF